MEDTVTIPWGDWVSQIIEIFAVALGAFVVWVFKRFVDTLGPQFKAVLMMIRAEQLIGRAVDHAVQEVAGAARGQMLNVEIANPVLHKAVEYAKKSGGDIVDWLGESDLPDKILARLDVEPEATVERDEKGIVKQIIRGGKPTA